MSPADQSGGQRTQPWVTVNSGLIIHFRLTPKSSKEGVEGVVSTPEGPAFQARVRAIPANGEANAAVVRLAAAWLDVPKSSVTLILGSKSRLKSVQVSGDTNALVARLETRLRAFQAAQQAAQ